MSGASATKSSKKLKSAEKLQDEKNQQVKVDENEIELKRKSAKSQEDAKEDSSGNRKSLRLSKLNQFKVEQPTQPKQQTSKRKEKPTNEPLDIKKLVKNVDNIEKHLSEHSLLFKKLNKSIQRLSDKLEDEKELQQQVEVTKEGLNETETDQQAPTSTPKSLTTPKRNQNKHQIEKSLTTLKLEKINDDEEEKINLKKTPKIASNVESIRFSSDSEEDDDDLDYQENTRARNGKNKIEKRSLASNSNTTSATSPCKTNLKAILNKTKIDIDFITNLIPSKYINDKRYDPNEINKLRLLSHSYQNFAVKLLVRLFDEEEIIGRNVYGRNYSGDKSFMKKPLDAERIDFIKETVLRLTKTNSAELAWASCVIAMNRKMVDINNKFGKSSKPNEEADDS